MRRSSRSAARRGRNVFAAAPPRSRRWSRCRRSAPRSISRSARPTCRDSRSPSRAAAPLQNRSLETLVAQVEAHLEKNPEDGRGWEVIAPVYVRLGRLEDAVKARRNALRINKDERRKPDLEAELGETLDRGGERRGHAGGEGRVRARGRAGCAAPEGALLPRRRGASGRRGGKSARDLARHRARHRHGFAMGDHGAPGARAASRVRAARRVRARRMSQRRSRWTRRIAPR